MLELKGRFQRSCEFFLEISLYMRKFSQREEIIEPDILITICVPKQTFLSSFYFSRHSLGLSRQDRAVAAASITKAERSCTHLAAGISDLCFNLVFDELNDVKARSCKVFPEIPK